MKRQLCHRGTLDTTPLGRYAFQTPLKNITPKGPHTLKYCCSTDIFGSAHPENTDNTEQMQSPCARATHYRGQNAAVAPEKPAAPTRSAGAPVATSGTTIALFFVRPQTTPAAPAPQALAPALHEPATAMCHASHSSKSCSRASHSSKSCSRASHSVCGPGTARRASSPGIRSARSPERSSASPPPVITPPEAGVGVPRVPIILPFVLLSPPAVTTPRWWMMQKSTQT